MTDELWLQAVPGGPVPVSAVPVREVPADTRPFDQETRERILAAADHLVRQLGMAKTNMTDVARAARVARGTLYRYFESRDALFRAVSQRATDHFFAAAAAKMSRQSTLSDQFGEFSEMLIRSIHPSAAAVEANSRALMIHMLATQSVHALRRTAGFLRPYVEAAKGRGEVRSDLDIADGAEWLARILLSFTVFQASVSYEADDPASVRQFVQRYAIDGLAGR
jgi:AcrR family transcriptional regulator